MKWLAVLLLWFWALPLKAEQVIAGFSQDHISITANFDGSDILIFGAVKREMKIPEGTLDVIVTIQGPSTPVIVRHKARKMGIWINTEQVRFTEAPSFYAIATTRPFAEVLTATEDLRHRVTIPQAIRIVGAATSTDRPQDFAEAVIRIRERLELYHLLEGAVDIRDATLFKTQFNLPANLTEGEYKTRIILTREGKVVDVHESVIDVRKEGLERWLNRLAHEKPLYYGLLSLLMAVTAGWAASEAFRLMRT